MSRMDEHLGPHVSALVDGELEPLEAVALHHELNQNQGLAREYDEMKRLKLAVRLAGRQAEAPPDLGEQLLAQTKAHFQRTSTTTFTRKAWAVALAASALLAGLAGIRTIQEPQGLAHMEVEYHPDGEQLLKRLFRYHRGLAESASLNDLVKQGILLSTERLPSRLIIGKAPKRQVLQASYPRYVESKQALTLAVVNATHVDLPEDIDEALEAYGAYVEELEGLSIRLSREGDKLYILMSDETLDALESSI